jgi:hypothetical protein
MRRNSACVTIQRVPYPGGIRRPRRRLAFRGRVESLQSLSLLLPSGRDSGKKVPPPWGGLSGSVTLSGKPAKEVTVVFENRQSGVALMNTTDDNGHFEIRSPESSGLAVGDYKISIVPIYHLVPTDGHQGSASGGQLRGAGEVSGGEDQRPDVYYPRGTEFPRPGDDALRRPSTRLLGNG